MSKEYFEMQILCSLLLMPPKRSPDISKSSRYPWSIPVLQMRTLSGGISALAHLFYVGFCGFPLTCHGSGSRFPAQSDQASSKPRSTGDLAQALHTQSIPTRFLPCYASPHIFLHRCAEREWTTGAPSPRACDQIISPSVTHPNHHSWRSCQQY